MRVVNESTVNEATFGSQLEIDMLVDDIMDEVEIPLKLSRKLKLRSNWYDDLADALAGKGLGSTVYVLDNKEVQVSIDVRKKYVRAEISSSNQEITGELEDMIAGAWSIASRIGGKLRFKYSN